VAAVQLLAQVLELLVRLAQVLTVEPRVQVQAAAVAVLAVQLQVQVSELPELVLEPPVQGLPFS